MLGALRQTDALLHGVDAFDPAAVRRPPAWWLPAIVIGFAPLYGGLMGSLYVESSGRLLQVVYSGVKVPLLLFATTLLCLPGFFVFNTIFGLRSDFGAAMRAIVAGQAGMSIALASFAPLVRFWYFCSDSYREALLVNAFLFGVAALAGHIVMLRYYRPLIRRRRIHRLMLIGWLVLYAFVGIQMGWTLRPFVGAPDIAVSFFRDEPFTNAYIVVARLIFG